MTCKWYEYGLDIINDSRLYRLQPEAMTKLVEACVTGGDLGLAADWVLRLDDPILIVSFTGRVKPHPWICRVLEMIEGRSVDWSCFVHTKRGGTPLSLGRMIDAHIHYVNKRYYEAAVAALLAARKGVAAAYKLALMLEAYRRVRGHPPPRNWYRLRHRAEVIDEAARGLLSAGFHPIQVTVYLAGGRVDREAYNMLIKKYGLYISSRRKRLGILYRGGYWLPSKSGFKRRVESVARSIQ